MEEKLQLGWHPTSESLIRLFFVMWVIMIGLVCERVFVL